MSNQNSDASAVSLYRRLTIDRKERQRTGLFAVEGVRNIANAAQNGWQFQHVIRSKLLLKSRVGRATVSGLAEQNVPVTNVSPKVLRTLTLQQRVSGIVAIVRQRIRSLPEISPETDPLWMAVTRIRSYGNLGTLLRSSAAFGGSGLMLIGDALDPFEPSVLRAAMGAAFRQSYVRTTWAELLDLASDHWTIVGADASATENVGERSWPRGSVIMLGDERKGLSVRQRQACHRLIRIPMHPESDSLNVAIAGSLILHHAGSRLRGLNQQSS